MLSTQALCESVHKRQILSTDIDYYNRNVCTSSADGLVRIMDIAEPEKYAPVELREHVGPVWQVMFSHPKYDFLASCGSDCKLILYKTDKTNKWNVVYKYTGHGSSVNAVDWAPHAAGAVIACASSDGCISVHTLNGQQWSVAKIPNAHANGVNCVSWSSALVNDRTLLASGGNDNAIKIWQEKKCVWNAVYESDNQLSAIKDLSWCPKPGLETYMIASCAANGRVFVWTSDELCDWTQTEVDDDETQQQKVSWSRMGNILSVSLATNVVKLWKQVDKKLWMCLDTQVAKKLPDFESHNRSNINSDIFAAIV